MTNCKMCKSTNISQLDNVEDISYKGNILAVSMEYSVCNDCKREFIPKPQILNNDARIRDAKKRADGLLTSTEIYNARISLGLTQEQASLVFGGGKNAFSKYERAEVSQSIAMDKLIRISLKHPSVFHELQVCAGIKVANAQLMYEDNIIPYPSTAANQAQFETVKSIEKTKVKSYG